MSARSIGLLAAMVANVAVAAPTATLESQGSDVIVRIPGASATGSVVASGDRIYVPIAAGAPMGRVDLADETVKRVEVASQKIIIGLHHSKKSTELTAARTQVESKGDTLIVRMPRSPRGAVARAETPASAPVVEKAAEKLGGASEVKATTPVVNAAPPPVSAAAAAPSLVSKPIPMPTEGVDYDKQPIDLPSSTVAMPLAADAGWPSATRMVAFALLLLLGGIALYMKIRQQTRGSGGKKDPKESIKILASQALHGKARLVLVEAKGRELLVAVHEGRTDVLSDWSADDLEGDLDAELAAPTREMTAVKLQPATAPTPPAAAAPVTNAAPAPRRSSPAVAGLLRLRKAAKSRAAESTSATETDSEWARELTAAVAKRSAS